MHCPVLAEGPGSDAMLSTEGLDSKSEPTLNVSESDVVLPSKSKVALIRYLPWASVVGISNCFCSFEVS